MCIICILVFPHLKDTKTIQIIGCWNILKSQYFKKSYLMHLQVEKFLEIFWRVWYNKGKNLFTKCD